MRPGAHLGVQQATSLLLSTRRQKALLAAETGSSSEYDHRSLLSLHEIHLDTVLNWAGESGILIPDGETNKFLHLILSMEKEGAKNLLRLSLPHAVSSSGFSLLLFAAILLSMSILI